MNKIKMIKVKMSEKCVFGLVDDNGNNFDFANKIFNAVYSGGQYHIFYEQCNFIYTMQFCESEIFEVIEEKIEYEKTQVENVKIPAMTLKEFLGQSVSKIELNND
tara:strand:+ start:33599 stop:33913 length:315 start_codon:yes stop_codon:yes gene_type:complete